MRTRLERRGLARDEKGAQVVQLVFCMPVILALLAGCVQMVFLELSATTLAGEIDYAAGAVEPAVLEGFNGDETLEDAYVKGVLESKVVTVKALDSLEVSDVSLEYGPSMSEETELDADDERNIIHDPLGDYVLSEFDSSSTSVTVRFTVSYRVPEFFPSPVGSPTLTRTIARDHIIDARAEVM